MEFLDRFFHLSEHHTSVKSEFLGAISSFLAVCYLFIVIPHMLADAGMPITDATVAVIWASVIGTFVMAIFANFPVAVAPGLGIAAYFAYYICGPMGLSWQAGCAAVVVSGIVFFLLTVTHIRQAIIDAIPLELKFAVVAGIGCFIAIIGLNNAGIIVANKGTLVALGDLTKAPAYLTIIGVLLAGYLMARGIKIGMLIAIVVVALLGVVLGATPLPKAEDFSQHFELLPVNTVLQLDFKGMLTAGILSVLFSITMVDLFDNMSTLIGLSTRAGFMKPNGQIPGLGRALLCDSVSTMSAGVLGTPTATSILESAVGIEAGARTGLSSLFLVVFFLLSLLLTPLLVIVPTFATACVLILVGFLMMQTSIHRINFADPTSGIPCFLTLFMMPLTFNIANGLGFGVISWVVLKLLMGKTKDVSLVMLILAVIFAVTLIMH